MMSPLVSVIMPSYNHEEYIGQAIGSVLDQTMSDIELIIVDDASEDGSREIIESYADRDERVRPIFHDENRGIAKTVNDALSRTNGKYVAHTASDDLWATNKLARQLDVLNSASGSLVWTRGEVIDRNGNQIGETFLERHNAEDSPKSGCLFHKLIGGNYIFGTSILYDSTIRKGIQFDTNLRYLNDYKFMLDLSVRTRFEYVNEPLTYYRVHKTNTTSNRDWNDTVAREQLVIRDYVRNEYEELLERGHLRGTYLQDAANQFRLEEYRHGMHSLTKAIQADPYSIENVLYTGYLAMSFVPGAQPMLSYIWNESRSIFDRILTEK